MTNITDKINEAGGKIWEREMKFSDLKITDRIVDKDLGFFSVVFDNGKELQCCLVQDGSTSDENGFIHVQFKKEINEPDSGYNWGMCKEVNEWAFEQGLADWSDINTFLCDQAQKSGVTITQEH